MKIEIKNDKNKKNLLMSLEGKNINFLIGSGASMPYLKTLSLGENISFEDILEEIEKEGTKDEKNLAAAFFIENSLINGTYKTILEKKNEDNPELNYVYKNYSDFINNVDKILKGNSIQKPKRVNIFTTNYDMFFETVFDEISKINSTINFNDGSVGFIDKTISTQRFHYKMLNVGVDNKYEYELPMINIIKLHGSLNWEIKDGLIHINNENIMEPKLNLTVDMELINNKSSFISEMKKQGIPKDGKFWEKLNKITIVRPSKMKFRKTVFEEHFYQTMRLLVQELEREQTVLLVFGFSFEDEHILSLVKRSLQNPGLIIYIFVYKEENCKDFSNKFKGFVNIRLVINKCDTNSIGDFNFFNKILGAQSYE